MRRLGKLLWPAMMPPKVLKSPKVCIITRQSRVLLKAILSDSAPPDPRAFAEVVDIVPKLSPSSQTDLKSSKWKERKEALDTLSTLLTNIPRIKDAPELAELSRSLATCIAKDANISCVMGAAKCLEDLAKGIMAPFGKYHEVLVPLMLERMKERKVTVTDTIGAALDAIFSTV